MSYIEELGTAAKKAELAMTTVGTKQKNAALAAIAESLEKNKDLIIKENKRDIENAKVNGMSEAMIDRLTLTEARISGMSEGVRQVMELKDPINEIIGGEELPNGLIVEKIRVPLGVIGIIFESRPNVTVDAAALCLKSGNVCILRGGSDAIYSNKCLVGIMRDAIKENGIPEDAVQLVVDTSRAVAGDLMKADKYIDVLILKSMKPETGRCAILFPHGVLFREEEKEMRKRLVESDLVECVIGLGKNLFYNSPMEACIVICRTNKPQERKHKVQFIDARKEVTRKNAESYMTEEQILRVANTYLGYQNEDRFSAIAPLEEILSNDAKLSIPLYVHNYTEADDTIAVEDAIAEWMEASALCSEECQLVAKLIERGDTHAV